MTTEHNTPTNIALQSFGHVAAAYHGGDACPLYAVASTGTLSARDTDTLRERARLLESVAADAQAIAENAGDWEDAAELADLIEAVETWLDAHPEDDDDHETVMDGIRAELFGGEVLR